MKIHFLKVIWGDAVMLENNGEYALIDTGYDKTFPYIREYLDGLGVKELSFILLTHFHRDHYGSIPAILDEYKVNRVYFKEYSGLEKSTAWGTPAEDEYRQSELDKCAAMREAIREKSMLVPAEETKVVPFSGYEMHLFSTENRVRAVYEDESCPERYHSITCGENANSLAAFMKVGKVNLFFGGDIGDSPSNHPLLNRINTGIAQRIGEEIDIYKVPHHGTGGCNRPEALDIYKPKIAVITNHIKYLSEKSPIFEDLRRANPDVKIYLTELSEVVIDVSEDGKVTVEKGTEI